MDSRFRALVERVLPWYSAAAEADHDARSEAIRQRSIRARVRAERLRDIASPERLGSYGRVVIRK